jgi:hypothetical protein
MASPGWYDGFKSVCGGNTAETNTRLEEIRIKVDTISHWTRRRTKESILINDVKRQISHTYVDKTSHA